MGRKAKYIIKRTRDHKFHFVLKSTNGKVVLSSEVYENKSGALIGIASVRKNSRNAANFSLKVSNDGQYYFTLKAENGKVIGTSETYVTKQGSLRGLECVQRLNGSVENTMIIHK